MVTHYQILAVEHDATPAQIRRGYKAQALLSHPDKLDPGATESQKEAAQARFRQVREAFDVLSEPYKRKIYDYSIRPRAPPLNSQNLRNRSSSYFDEYQANLARERAAWAKQSDERQRERMRTTRPQDRNGASSSSGTPRTPAPESENTRPSSARAGSSSSASGSGSDRPKGAKDEWFSSAKGTARPAQKSSPVASAPRPDFPRASSSSSSGSASGSTRSPSTKDDNPVPKPAQAAPPPSEQSVPVPRPPPEPQLKHTTGRPLPTPPTPASAWFPPTTPRSPPQMARAPSSPAFTATSPRAPPAARTKSQPLPTRSPTSPASPLSPGMDADFGVLDQAALAEKILKELRARNPEWEARRRAAMQPQTRAP